MEKFIPGYFLEYILIFFIILILSYYADLLYISLLLIWKQLVSNERPAPEY